MEMQPDEDMYRGKGRCEKEGCNLRFAGSCSKIMVRNNRDQETY